MDFLKKFRESVLKISPDCPDTVNFNQWRAWCKENDPPMFDQYTKFGVIFKDLKDTHFPRREAKPERLVFRESANKSKSQVDSMDRQELFLRRLEETLAKQPKLEVKPLPVAKNAKKSRILNLVLSDLHFGAELDGKQTPLRFTNLEESRRFAKVILETSNYKRQYRKETTLFVHIIGDIIQGTIHDKRSGLPTASQFAAALSYLKQGIAYLSTQFDSIEVFMTPGNHDRMPDRHPDRAVDEPWDSYANMVYYSTKLALEHLKNVSFDIPYTKAYTVPLFNSRGFFTHGDTVFNVGFPGKSINVESLRKQVNEINGNSPGKECGVFVVGHVHTGSQVRLPTATVLTNGTILPSDPYALSIGIVSTRCGQWLFESVEDYPVGDSRFVEVSTKDDKDASLNDIIKPYVSFNG